MVRKILRPLITLISRWLTLLLLSAVLQAEPLLISTTATSPYHHENMSGLVDLLILEAFSRIQVDVDIKWLPGERSINAANAGETDGEAFRVYGLHEQYINLVPVKESLCQIHISAFSTRPISTKYGWADLQNLRIGILRGRKQLQQLTAGLEVIELNNHQSLFDMLQGDRIDVAVASEVISIEHLKKHQIEGVILNEPPLLVVPMFLYLNEEHKSLAEPLADVIRQMKQDGSYQQLGFWFY